MKEFGRAAYQNPLIRTQWTSKYEIKSYESIANAQSNNSNIAEVKNYSICGVNSLLVYNDVEEEGYDHESWKVENVYKGINYHLKNPKEYGIPLEDYWLGEKLITYSC